MYTDNLNMSFNFHLVSTSFIHATQSCKLFFSQNQCISQLFLELNGTELDEEEKTRNEDERRWREREEEISLQDFVPKESEYQLPMSKFTLLLVR